MRMEKIIPIYAVFTSKLKERRFIMNSIFPDNTERDIENFLKKSEKELEKEMWDNLHSQEFLNFDKENRNSDFVKEISRGKIKDEMLKYIISQVNQEFLGLSDEDAFDKWSEYKEKHNIK